jgi:hypothetical protein
MQDGKFDQARAAPREAMLMKESYTHEAVLTLGIPALSAVTDVNPDVAM